MGILSIYKLIAGSDLFNRKYKVLPINREPVINKAQYIEFKSRVNFHLEQNHSNCDYNVAGLSKDMGMSRSQLFRKCKLIFGNSPVALLKQYRLEKAKDYLKSGIYNVSEAAYLSGFNSLSYFSKSFKCHYREIPSRWVA